ncbi:hypothetical protein OY671_012481, partial [Metschnikowia pulcherrima]
PVHYSRPSVDVSFESAADVYGDRSLGVISTGANQDGAAGSHAIHRAGGVTVVQQPDSAKVPVMIVSALQRNPADLVSSSPEIAASLVGLG